MKTESLTAAMMPTGEERFRYLMNEALRKHGWDGNSPIEKGIVYSAAAEVLAGLWDLYATASAQRR